MTTLPKSVCCHCHRDLTVIPGALCAFGKKNDKGQLHIRKVRLYCDEVIRNTFGNQEHFIRLYTFPQTIEAMSEMRNSLNHRVHHLGDEIWPSLIRSELRDLGLLGERDLRTQRQAEVVKCFAEWNQVTVKV